MSASISFAHLLSPLSRWLHVTTLVGLLLAFSANSFAAADMEQINYPKILMEERAWAGLSSKQLRVDDVIWHYSEGGRMDRPVLLLLPGVNTNRDSWNQVARYLTAHYHVIALDLPGIGDTLVSKNFDYSLSHLVEQIRRFAEAAHIQQQLHIAGHSIGGSIAMLYAAQYAHDTASLFLMGAGGLFKSNRTDFLQQPIYLKHLVVTQAGDYPFVLKRTMQSPPFMPEVIRKQQELKLINHAQAYNILIQQLNQLNSQYSVESFAALIKNIESPTLILWGKQDQIVNVEVANELKQLIKHAEQPVLLNQVGHTAIQEAPEQVAQYYLQFLSQHR